MCVLILALSAGEGLSTPAVVVAGFAAAGVGVATLSGIDPDGLNQSSPEYHWDVHVDGYRDQRHTGALNQRKSDDNKITK